MKTGLVRLLRPASATVLGLSLLFAAGDLGAQNRGNPYGEWRYWGADAWSTRYSPLDQVNASNFSTLEVAWLWRGDNYGPSPDNLMRATPIYADGMLYSVAGERRTVVALDPATGETIWTYREPNTGRYEDSPRQNYGKGVAYAEVDGRGVIYMASPGFFLHALDAKTGLPLEGFGQAVPIEGFGTYGTVDMLANLDRAAGYDVYEGPDPRVGRITTSSPPIVVNGVVVVGSSAAEGGSYTRLEQIPGDILAYDARTGRHLWTFHVIPRPGEFGHDTWENDAWQWSGNANAWAPLSADLDRGIVYIPTDAPTNDYFGGFRPGNNLFGTSILALDVRTGQRVWHFQTVRHDIWDRDNPVAPVLLDVTVDGRAIPAVVQTTKQGLVFAFNRVTGEPIWPIPDVPQPTSQVPTEWTAPTQPIPNRPAPYEIQGLSIDELIDFTPELRARAVAAVANIRMGALYIPPVLAGADPTLTASAQCPGITGGLNIIGGTVADPETGYLYTASVKTCSYMAMAPGSARDNGAIGGRQTGVTVTDYASGGGRGPQPGNIDGLPLLKPPYGRITAINMNTGDHAFMIPNGDTPERIANNPLLAGLNIPNTGQAAQATALVTASLLMYGEGRSGEPRFHAVNKLTGERIGVIDLPGTSTTAPMTYLHEDVQYIVVPVSGGEADLPGSFVAFRLP